MLKYGSICTNSHVTWYCIMCIYYWSSTVYGMILYVDVFVVRSGLDPVMVIKLKWSTFVRGVQRVKGYGAASRIQCVNCTQLQRDPPAPRRDLPRNYATAQNLRRLTLGKFLQHIAWWSPQFSTTTKGKRLKAVCEELKINITRIINNVPCGAF